MTTDIPGKIWRFYSLGDPHRMRFYSGKGDQQFLRDHIWPYIQHQVFIHDSFLCQESYSRNCHPWPSRRRPLGNDTGCCRSMKYPFDQCPLVCRPSQHPDWTLC